MKRHFQVDLPMLAPMLYVPADRHDLAAVLDGKRDVGVCGIAVCLEDAVRPDNRKSAAAKLCSTLQSLEAPPRQIFVRPADTDALDWLLGYLPLEKIAGFILPKASVQSIHTWVEKSCGLHPIFPILETRDVLDPSGRRDLAQACAAHPSNIPGARIGANDLYSLLGGLRRPAGRTIYETPVGHLIDGLLEAFSAQDVSLCAPVCGRILDLETLRREVAEDIQRGLFAKTAIHPSQVREIWSAYRPDPVETDEANLILQPEAPAVFGLNGDMLEPACHSEWALRLLRRSALHRAAETDMNSILT